MSPVWAVGLMTGTVLDGMVDVALIRTDGERIYELGPWKLVPCGHEVRDLMARAMAAALEWQFQGPEPAIFREAEAAGTRAQVAAVREVLSQNGIAPREIAVVGFHGQTVLHRPPEQGRAGDTRQLGDGALMARLLATDVVYDFRTADMRAGGQGAPLSPIYHAALLRYIGAAPNSAVLNLGGLGNVTWWGGNDEVVAFDTGPANAPLNDWVVRHGLGDFDREGALAKQGRVDEARVQRLLEHPYFATPYPKSLDRYSFPAAVVDGLTAADGAATLTAFIAAAVGKALDQLPQRPQRIIVSGGGRKNPAILQEIAARGRVEPVSADAVGWRGDAVEAECFAYLAVRVARGLPISFPLTTGVKHPVTGGRLAKAPTADL